MNKDIKVCVTDGSYALLKRNKLFSKPHSIPGTSMMGETWTVLEVDKKLIADNSSMKILEAKEEWNDTIIKGNKTGRIVYIQERFLKAV